MSEREREHRLREPDDRPRGRARSTSPRRLKDRNDRRHERERHHSRSRSPLRKRHDRSGSRSRSPSPSRDRKRDKDREYKRRSRSRSRTRHKRHRSRSSSSSSSDSDNHKKRRKDKHRKRSKSRDREKDRERKEKKKAKKDKKKKGSSTAQWGKYGIINESNMYEKEAEFRTWLVEERMINPEVLSKDLTKKEFARFAEDYNTATLPHEKYYNIESYDRRMSSLRNGETLPPADDGYDPNADLRAHTSAHKKTATEKDTYMSYEQLQELRRVQQERHQVAKMKLMGMNIGQSFGVRMDGSAFDG